MRRTLSLQASRALLSTIQRILIVAAVLVAYWFAARWAEPYIAWWVVAVAGLVLLGALQFLGSRWLERDVLRAAREDSEK